MVVPSQAEVVWMRGRQDLQLSTLAFVDRSRAPPLGHPLRTIRSIADEALADLSLVFDAMYVDDGRPSIPPERMLKASLLMSLCSIRSERAFCKQLEYHLLYRRFAGMSLVEPVFDRPTFSKNRGQPVSPSVRSSPP
jgi:transposase